MTSNLQALLAAIVADPADDVARLVYADCLEEHGNAARAQFIRLQIEAERHHPDSNTRAKLERQARSLLEENWIAWWAEVCAAVGFPQPAKPPVTRLGRLADRIGLRRIGSSYAVTDFTVVGSGGDCFSTATFRRGFPDAVKLLYRPQDFLTSWLTVSPLQEVTMFGQMPPTWLGGPHLAGVCALVLCEIRPALLSHILRSPHLDKLESLSLDVSDPEDHIPYMTYELERLTSSPRARQLKRLTVPVWDDRTAEVLADAASLAGLETLEVALLPDESNWWPPGANEASRRLRTLARSPHLAGLKELIVTGVTDASGLADTIQNPTWRGLRKLELDFRYTREPLAHAPLGDPDDLPLLDEVRLRRVLLIDAPAIDVLIRSPLLKRIKHFALLTECSEDHPGIPGFLFEAIDPNRIETFAVWEWQSRSLKNMLRTRYGDRVRFYSY